MGMVPASLAMLSLVWALAEMVAGAIAGAWVYRE
jgi:hypothetical protein